MRSRRLLSSALSMAAALPWLTWSCAAPDDAARAPSSLVSSTSTGPSTRDLGAGAEIALDQPVTTPAPGSHAAVGFDGTGYFVAWDDYRALRPVLFGTRVAADGTVLDPLGIPLLDSPSPFGSYDYRPSIAFDGTAYLVVGEVANAIHGLRVSPQGQVLGDGAFPISDALPNLFGHKVIFDGTNHVVTWARQSPEDSTKGSIYLARVSPDGTVLDPGGIEVVAEHTRHVDLAFDGENYLLAWVRTSTGQRAQVVGARVTPAGVVLDPGGFPITQHPEGVSSHVSIPAVAFDGTSYVVAWSTFLEEATYHEDLYATRVSPAGEVLEPAEIFIATFPSKSHDFSRIVAVPSSAGTLLAWSRDAGSSSWQEVEVALVPVTGDAIVPPPENSPGTGVDVALAAGNGGALMAWTAGGFEPNQNFTPIAAARLDVDGTTIDPDSFPVTGHANAQEVRAVASDGQSYLVLWTDARNPASQGRSLYGARVSADGTVLDAEGILITPEDVDVVDVVFDGENYLVMFVRQYYESDNPLHAVRVSPQGQVLDASSLQLPLCSQSHTPHAARAGEHMLLIANGCDLETRALAAVVIDRRGRAQSTPVALVPSDDRDQVEEPAVASDGTSYLVTWHDSYTLYGRRVDAAGAPIGDAFAITSSSPGKYISRAAVRFGNGHYYVVWLSVDGIFGARVDTAGQVLDPDGFSIVPAPAPQALIFTGALAFRGENLVVAYQRLTEPGNYSSPDNHVIEVGPTGAVLSQFPIAATPESEGAPVLAENDAQQVLTAYSRYVPEAAVSARRALARLLVEAAEPGPDAGPGTPDAGPGTPDAGPGAPDAGNPPGNPGDGDGDGCGCAATASPGDAGLFVLLALGLFLALRRRPDLSE